ncbi:MAG: TolC family protein, partial [Bdellovibrionales bacterium]
ARARIPVADSLTVYSVEDFDQGALFELARVSQPELSAAGLRQAAANLGVEVARLRRVPDVTLSFSWYGVQDNRPPSTIVNVGQDPWSIGAAINIPLWTGKYDAIQREARSRFEAAIASRQDLERRYDAAIAEALARAKAAQKVATLYGKSILPQARQTLQVDLEAYQQSKVEFDRVILDFRNLVNLEIYFHQAVGELAIATARLEQLVGRQLVPMGPTSPADGK